MAYLDVSVADIDREMQKIEDINLFTWVSIGRNKYDNVGMLV
jgi:hypothetical protein